MNGVTLADRSHFVRDLLAFSCKTRDLCPSCAAKRAAVTAASLRDDVLQEVGHSQWVFVMPKMLRLYFLHHRERGPPGWADLEAAS